MFEDLLLFNIADGDTKRFLEEFDRLASWVDNSLDLYKVLRVDLNIHSSVAMAASIAYRVRGAQLREIELT